MFSEFVTELKKRGIEIYFFSGRIRYKAPENSITPEILQKMKEFKKELIEYYWPPECNNLLAVNNEGSMIPIIMVDNIGFAHRLSKHLGPDQPLYVFYEDIWKDGRKYSFNSIPELSQKYIYQLEQIMGTGPVILGGYCFGGLVAYEMASKLRSIGRDIPLILLFNSQNPQDEKIIIKKNQLKSKISNLNTPQKVINDSFKRVKISLYSFMKKIFRDLVGTLLVPFRTVPNLLVRHYHIYHQSQLISKYNPSATDCKLLLFRADKGNYLRDLSMGWGDLVPSLTIVELDVSHNEITMNEKIIEIMSMEIQRYIN